MEFLLVAESAVRHSFTLWVLKKVDTPSASSDEPRLHGQHHLGGSHLSLRLAAFPPERLPGCQLRKARESEDVELVAGTHGTRRRSSSLPHDNHLVSRATTFAPQVWIWPSDGISTAPKRGGKPPCPKCSHKSPTCHGLASPTKKGFGQQGLPPQCFNAISAQRLAVSARSSGMPPDVGRRFAMD